MTARKPPKTPEDRLARWARSMTPGTVAGRVASAQPLPLDLSAKLRASPGSPNPGGNTAWQQDDFTSQVVGTPPPTAYTLTFLPISQSERIYARGRHLRPGTEYTLSGQVATLASGLLIAGDPLTADYEYYLSLPSTVSQGAFGTSATATSGTVSVSSISVTCPTVNAGDLLLFWPSISAGSVVPTTVTGPAGWTNRVASTCTPDTHIDNAVAAGLWSKVATGSEGGTSITATFSTSNRAVALLLVYPGATISAVSSNSATTIVPSWTAPTPAAANGKTCVYFFALSGNNAGPISLGSPAVARASVAPAGYACLAAGDATSAGPNAPSESATATGSGASTNAMWIAATVVL